MSYQDPATFRQYSITSGSFDGVPDPVVQEMLNVAADTINSALVVKHELPLASVPAAVLEWERVITAFFLWQNMGIDPGANAGYVQRRYLEVVGDPDKPDSGILGQMAYGHRALVADPNDGTGSDGAMGGDPSTEHPGYRVIGNAPRGWYTRIAGRQFIS